MLLTEMGRRGLEPHWLTAEEEEAHGLFLLDRATWPLGDPHAAPVEEFELD